MHRWDGEKAPRVVTRRGAGCIRLARDAQGRLTLTLPLGAPPGADRLFLQGWREGRALAPAGASDAFPQRLAAEAARLAGQLGFPAPELRAETEKPVWGRCLWRQGLITLHPFLARLPEAVQTEALLHELLHFRFHDHSPAFWQALTDCMPDWPRQEGLLRACAKASACPGGD